MLSLFGQIVVTALILVFVVGVPIFLYRENKGETMTIGGRLYQIVLAYWPFSGIAGIVAFTSVEHPTTVETVVGLLSLLPAYGFGYAAFITWLG